MIAVLQQGPDEDPGFIPELLAERALPHGIVRLFDGEEVPQSRRSGFIILGGQMSPGDEREFPFLADEKALIGSCLEAGIPVLGICLGAQLIAAAAGMRVYRGVREQGWTRIRLAETAPVPLPEAPVVFQWHNDTFDLPPGARLHYTGDVIRNQMFSLGSCIGVQFHPEVTTATIARWCMDIGEAERETIGEGTSGHLRENRKLCGTLIDMAFRRWH